MGGARPAADYAKTGASLRRDTCLLARMAGTDGATFPVAIKTILALHWETTAPDATFSSSREPVEP